MTIHQKVSALWPTHWMPSIYMKTNYCRRLRRRRRAHTRQTNTTKPLCAMWRVYTLLFIQLNRIVPSVLWSSWKKIRFVVAQFFLFKFILQRCAKRFFYFFPYKKFFCSSDSDSRTHTHTRLKKIRFRLEYIESFSCYWTAICWYSSGCTYEPYGWWRWCRRSGTQKNTKKS